MNRRVATVERFATLKRKVLGATAAVGMLVSAPLNGADVVESSGKDYAIFVGTDLTVRDENQRHPVVGASRGAVVVRTGDTTRRMEVKGIEGLQYERGVKLSRLSAEVTDVKVSFSSQAADRAWMESTSIQIALQDRASAARDHAASKATQAASMHIPPGVDPFTAHAELRAQTEMEMRSAIEDSALQERTAVDYRADRHTDIGQLGADTVGVVFMLTPKLPLGKGYVALITEYRTGGQREGIEHGISVQEFEDLDGRPKRIRLQQDSLPGEWTMHSYRIAVFAEGQEVATNLSERRVDVSKDEAHQFFVLQYVMANSGRTRGPSTIAMAPKKLIQETARNASLPREVYVEVDKEGVAQSISAEKFGGPALPSSAAAALDDIRFLPALKDGVPIDGRARFEVADIVR